MYFFDRLENFISKFVLIASTDFWYFSELFAFWVNATFHLKRQYHAFSTQTLSILMINCYSKGLLFELFSVDQSNREAACFFGPTPAEAKALNQPTHEAKTSESPQEELSEPVPNKRMKNTSSTQLTETFPLLGNSDNESSTIPLPANNYNDWMAKGKPIISKN